ncbi:MAG: anaerobic carbon-monoxide dehydrogenase catalytic subunit [Actinomycetia bacterium]|nr:anaerobic carbon-monoxide dehydrogenase catalytic subunit [Actinomycetes bacterium]
MAEKRTIEEKTIWPDARAMLRKAEAEGIQTVFDRLDDQTPHCNFCEAGLTCRNCTMGPCRISDRSGAAKMTIGVCGATGDTIVARNFARFVAGGSAGHCDHGRDLIETLKLISRGEAPGYSIRDEAKLRALAAEMKVADAADGELLHVAGELADVCYDEFGSKLDHLTLVERAPKVRQELWSSLKMMPRGVDREVVETMHRTHMGCDNDPISLLVQSARTALADGWGGSMIGTELSDAIFGTPKPVSSKVNLGVLKEDQVNIMVHGHNPVVSEMILGAAREPELVERAKALGASGINVVGLCCTGNELLMRQGIPMAGNHLMTELALITGAVEAIVVDYQCIMPSLTHIASCYHTKFISTSPKGRFPGELHMEVNPRNAQEVCREIVALAVEGFAARDKNRVEIPGEPVDIMSGFSNEAILGALGGTPDPLLDAIKAGKIKGVVGIVGCNNPKYQHDSCNVGLAKELIKRGILVLVTGCVTVAMGKAGLLMPEAAAEAAPGLREVCEALGIPPVLHVGSCVDNSRILALCAVLANTLGVDISDLPVAASAPEWYSEKAAAIGLYAVASGIPTHLGHPPNITGSAAVTGMATGGLNDVVGAAFMVDPDPMGAADKLEAVINERRAKLGI